MKYILSCFKCKSSRSLFKIRVYNVDTYRNIEFALVDAWNSTRTHIKINHNRSARNYTEIPSRLWATGGTVRIPQGFARIGYPRPVCPSKPAVGLNIPIIRDAHLGEP